ncbi:unnamed protein product, partial [Oppiella nova]
MDVDPTVYTRASDLQRQSADQLIRDVPINREYDVIVDIGCGNGYLTERLARHVKHNVVIGVDINPTMISYALKNHKMDSIEYWTQDMSVSWDELCPPLKALEAR